MTNTNSFRNGLPKSCLFESIPQLNVFIISLGSKTLDHSINTDDKWRSQFIGQKKRRDILLAIVELRIIVGVELPTWTWLSLNEGLLVAQTHESLNYKSQTGYLSPNNYGAASCQSNKIERRCCNTNTYIPYHNICKTPIVLDGGRGGGGGSSIFGHKPAADE